MSKSMSSTGLAMFAGGPDNLQSGDEVMIHAVALADNSNNYHFFPHVAWVEPGTTVKWEHFVKQGVSDARVHTSTALTGKHFGTRLIPESATGWDSKLMSGTGSMMSVKNRFFDSKENGGITNNYGKKVINSQSTQIRGGFSHTFEEQGVYMYYCQNHYKFKMAGAIVVGPLSADNKAEGWAPAMTADISGLEEYVGGEALADQIGELRGFVKKGGSGGM